MLMWVVGNRTGRLRTEQKSVNIIPRTAQGHRLQEPGVNFSVGDP